MNGVNNKTDYTTTTVLLENDLDFAGLSDRFVPSGTTKADYFLGSLDGQGHTISNLNFKGSTIRFVGFIGYSNGMTIRNLVMDDSCSFESSYNVTEELSYPYVAGIIGACLSYERPCYIESSVNMASVLYSGEAKNDVFLAGIAAKLESYEYEVAIKNCANYGEIKSIGKGTYINLGGIAGIISEGTRPIQNCINYGEIVNQGTTTDDIRVGGIVGIAAVGNSSVDNCVSAGKITSTQQTSVASFGGFPLSMGT